MRMMVSWLVAATLVTGAGALGAERVEADGGKVKILLIGHGPDHPHGTHEYLPDSRLLATCLRQTRGVEAVVSDGWPKDPAVLEGVKAIVLHVRMGGDLLFDAGHQHASGGGFDGPQRRLAERLLKEGVGLTAIHWGTGCSVGEVGDLWLKTLGGHFNADAFSRYLVEMTTLRRAEPDHPISRGWKDFEIRDEWYIKLRFLPEARPMIMARVEGEDYPVGWIYERPDSARGRSFGFVGGHFHDNFGNESFRRLVVNGILWTAHVEVPEGGAPCKITEKDMELPPRE